LDLLDAAALLDQERLAGHDVRIGELNLLLTLAVAREVAYYNIDFVRLQIGNTVGRARVNDLEFDAEVLCHRLGNINVVPIRISGSILEAERGEAQAIGNPDSTALLNCLKCRVLCSSCRRCCACLSGGAACEDHRSDGRYRHRRHDPRCPFHL
jgi:hypothetical protein